MTMEPPRPRYRVVEQGRRLVVIDTLTGAPAVRPQPQPSGEGATAATGPERTAFDGRSTLVTRSFYDDKAPRTLTLDPGATALIEKGRSGLIAIGLFLAVVAVAFPWLLLFPLLLIDRRVRAALRAPVTRWLDRYDTGVRDG